MFVVIVIGIVIVVIVIVIVIVIVTVIVIVVIVIVIVVCFSFVICRSCQVFVALEKTSMAKCCLIKHSKPTNQKLSYQ